MAKNRLELVLLLLILVSAAFFRLYHIGEYMTFLGDEGRDALVIKDLLVNHHIPTLGPPTSVGNIYLGPLYYYLMGISMSVSWLNPVAAAVMNALIGIATVFLVYYLTKLLFDRWSGLIAAWLYNISPVNIIYSHSSWNPNPAPFFALLTILFFHKFKTTKRTKWMVLCGLTAGAAVQMHYLALVLAATIVFLLIYILFQERFKHKKTFTQSLVLFSGGFWVTLIPWVLFDLKHNFMNLRAIWAVFAGPTQAVGRPNFLIKIWEITTNNLFGEYIAAGDSFIATMLTLLILVYLIKIFLKVKSETFRWSFYLVGVWLIGGILGVSFYKGPVYAHYLGFLNPAPFILLGSLFFFISRSPVNWPSKQRIIKALGYFVSGLLLFQISLTNLQSNPLLSPPNNQLKRTQEVAKYVIEKSDNKPFNFALLSKNNYDAAYQFYLDQYGHPPKVVPVEKTDQLYVVCEDQECKPVGHPKYEIAGFGMSKIESQTDVLGVKVFKLIANPSGKPS